MMWTFQAHLARPANRILAAVSFAILVAHVVLRSTAWRHEWLWAMVQLNYVTVLLGPVAAAAGAYEAGRWHRVVPGARPRATRVAYAGRILAAQVVVVVGIYLVGLVVVIAAVRGADTPGWPTADALAAVPAGLAFLAGWSAVGCAIGISVGRSAAVAPAVLVGALAVAILGYFLPGHLTDVGGATASLVGLQVVDGLFASQALLWAAIAASALGALARPRSRALAAVGVGLAVGAAAFAWQLHLGEDRLEPAPADLSCDGDGDGAVICLAPGYEQFRPRVEAATAPARRLLAAAAIDDELVFTQDAPHMDRYERAAYVDASMLRGDQRSGAVAVANALIPPTCDLFADLGAGTAFDTVLQALESPDPAAGQVLGTAIERLERCGGS